MTEKMKAYQARRKQRVKDVAAFKKLVDEHDWYYSQSDDSRIYEKGKAQEESIKKTMMFDNKLSDIYYKKRKQILGEPSYV
jgi:hypothetical protein